MTKKQLKGEIYEIQGILYIIASYFVHTPWIATVVFLLGSNHDCGRWHLSNIEKE
jgi:hypothetical protein